MFQYIGKLGLIALVLFTNSLHNGLDWETMSSLASLQGRYYIFYVQFFNFIYFFIIITIMFIFNLEI